MSVENSVPSLVFDVSSLSEEERWDAWREYNSGLFDIEPPDTDQVGVVGRTETFMMGNLIIGENAHSGMNFIRDEKKVRFSGEEQLVLLINKQGVSHNLMGDRSVTNSPDLYTLYDLNQTIDIHTPATEYLYAVIPYASIGYDPSKHSNALQLKADSAAGHLLKSNLEMMQGLGSTISAQEAASMGAGFENLLNALVRHDLREQSVFEGFQTAREVALHRFIRTNARNPQMSASYACKMLGMSRATLYRMMEEAGGFNHALMRVRLTGARRELAKWSRERGAVQEIATRWGFCDAAYFTRSFKQTFGVTPSDVLGEACDNSMDAPDHRHQRSDEIRDIRQLSKLIHFGSWA